MNKLFYNDWLIIDNIAIKDVANMVKKGIKTTLPISLRSRSTAGRAKQYKLFKYFKNNSALNKLKERILANINKSLQLQVSDLKLVSAWTVLGYKNSYHTLHKHSNTKQNHIACVLYLNVPNSTSKKEGSLFYVYKRDQEINSGIHTPRVGDLVIFPIWLWHGTHPQSKGLRQTLNLDFEIC